MNWAERIVSLPPILVTGAFLLTTAIGAALMELFPIGSALSWLAFALAAALNFAVMLVWLGAVHTLARSRSASEKLRRERLAFASLAFWWLVWCVCAALLPALTPELIAIPGIATLVASFFFLQTVWICTSALLEFEHSDDWFWTFVKLLYFPIGVWFLQPRLRTLLSAPAHTAASTP